MTTTAISAQANKHEVAGLEKYGDWIVRRIATVLGAKCQHRNQDGSYFTPHILSSVVYAPWYQVIALDPEALWHFRIGDLSGDMMLTALTATVQKQVRAITKVPGGNGRPDQHGLAFVVTLRDVPALDAPITTGTIPDKVILEAGARPAGAAGNLPVPLGAGRGGAQWNDLPYQGHTLIVGTTGSGKSTFIHSGLASLLASNGPDKLRLALIDPKRSEFSVWAGVPHLIGNIAHTEEDATLLLRKLAEEVDKRGDMMGAVLCRDIVSYNKQAKEPAPYILCAIDECLDLVLEAGNNSDFANYLKTIAIRGRSAGVILWAATQHAAAVTGLPRVVNVNLTARLVFRVADDNAARVAGCPGAERIPRDKPGRFLAKIDGGPVEVQGYYLPDEELKRVARCLGATVKKVTAPALTGIELDMVRWAVDENDGYLSLTDMQKQGALGQQQAKRLAGQWEQRGWLEKDPHRKNRRRLTDKAARLSVC